MPEFVGTNGETFEAEDQIEGILINPVLPSGFDATPNRDRPADQRRWWELPFIVTTSSEARTDAEEKRWRAAWLSGIRYDVRCLDGTSWDRSTLWGMFPTLEKAIARAKEGLPAWRRKEAATYGRWPGRSE